MTIDITNYVEHLKMRQANTDVSNILALQKAREIRKEISLFVEGLK